MSLTSAVPKKRDLSNILFLSCVPHQWLALGWKTILFALLLACPQLASAEETIVWLENFDDGNGDTRWYEATASGIWKMGSPTVGPQRNASGFRAFSGANCATTGLNGNYPDNKDELLVRIASFQVPAANQSPRLRFWHWYSIGGGDLAAVQIRPLGSNTWTTISSDYGDVGGFNYTPNGGGVWTRPSLDLRQFAGKTVQIAFHFTSDPGSAVAPNAGWFVDDVALVTGTPEFSNPEGFESGLGDWSTERGTWQVVSPASGPPINAVGSRALNGTNCAGLAVTGGNYQANVNSRFISPPLSVPAADQNPRLRFWHWYSIGGGDDATVEIRPLGSNTWTTVSSDYGDVGGFNYTPNGGGVWTRPSLDLSQFAGKTVQIAFHFISDPGSATAPNAGWFVDDVALVTGTPVFSNPEGFERGLGDWYADRGTWQVGSPQTGPFTNAMGARAYEGTNCAGLVMFGGHYQAFVNSRLISSRFTVPILAATPALRLRSWFDISSGDQAIIEIKPSNTAGWLGLSTNTGVSSTWTYPYIDLSAYANRTVQIAFRFVSYNNFGTGWFVDDVRIQNNILSPIPNTVLSAAVCWTNFSTVIGTGYTFTLSNAPVGMVVDTNGIISWCPTEAQGPRVYPNITLLVTQPGNALTPITSQSFTLTANFGTNTPASVAISYPPDNSAFTAPVDLTISANAIDPDDNIAEVLFVAGTTPIGVRTNEPFSVVWTNAPLGTHVLRALATVVSGGATITVTSAPVNVTVSLAPPTPPVFSLGSTVYGVSESAGSVAVTVFKSVNSLAGSVNYTTANGSALAVSGGLGDYQAMSGVLNFAAGDSSKTITIPIVDDPSYESNQQFAFILSLSGTNASLGTPSTATITIIDNDPPGSTNSFLENIFPAPVPAHDGYLRVVLQPANSGGQWRLVWENAWRNSSDAVGGLPSGNYEVEFKPVNGFLQSDNSTNPVLAGSFTSVTNTYIINGSPTYGALTVTLQPAVIANDPAESARAQWRLQGETNWHDSGFTITNLATGNQIVEFKRLADWITPAPRVAVVGAEQNNTLSATYLVAETSGSTLPTVLQFSDASSPAFGLPYVYNGQLASDFGYGSGCAVKRRVVLTAAHLVFDDATLSYAANVKWFFQRHADNPGALGPYEPPPLTPRGWYVFSGYAAARTNDNSPGVSSPASQNLDVAALYFPQDAGRGGQSGYLVSEPGATEWLQSSALKTLVGYPVEIVSEVNRGRMHATLPANLAFNRVTNRVFNTTSIRGYPGMSGGPLCVQSSTNLNSTYYPAAVYLGGSGQTIVRAIDSAVADLINRAEVASNTGDDNTGGGVIQLTPGAGTLFATGKFQLVIEPVEALLNGAGSGITSLTNAHFFNDNSATYGLPPGLYTLTNRPVPGFLTPRNRQLRVVANQTTVITNSYLSLAPRASAAARNGTLNLTFTAPAGQRYAIERSGNLVDWTPLLTNTVAGNGSLLFTVDNFADLPPGFYRARFVP